MFDHIKIAMSKRKRYTVVSFPVEIETEFYRKSILDFETVVKNLEFGNLDVDVFACTHHGEKVKVNSRFYRDNILEEFVSLDGNVTFILEFF